MSLELSYTPEEWQTLLFAPIWTFHQVARADGVIDQPEEEAFSTAINTPSYSKEPLAQEVLLALSHDFDGIMAQYEADPRALIEGLGQVADILDREATPEQAEHFKRTMLRIALDVAEASRGDTLGMGSKVSDEEARAIEKVAGALRF